LKSAKKAQKQPEINSTNPGDQVSKKLPMTTQKGADMDLLDLDFDVSPTKIVEVQPPVEFHPIIQPVTEQAPTTPARTPAPSDNPLDLLDLEAANAKLLQPPAAPTKHQDSTIVDFFDQIAVRNDLF
jgi:hypothetical protein